jgi:hypothetical protein
VLAAFPRLRGLLSQRWISSLREGGLTLSAGDRGFTVTGRVRTEAGELTSGDLPIAPSGPTPAVLRRGAEAGFGVSEPGRLARFSENVFQAVAPGRYARFLAARRKLENTTGVQLQRDLLARIQHAALAWDVRGHDIAARAGVTEARAFGTALRRAVPAIPELARALGFKDVGVAFPSLGQRFFAVAVRGHESIVFGLVGRDLVASDDTGRAGELVTEASGPAPGARGSLVVSLDAGKLAQQLAEPRVKGVQRLGLPIALGPIGGLTAWVAASRAGLRGQALLAIER